MLDKNDNFKVIKGVLTNRVNNVYFLRQKNSGQFQFDYLTGRKVLEEKRIRNFSENIVRNESICNSNNVEYLHVIYPAKPVAYIDWFKSLGVDIKPIVTTEHLVHEKVYYPQVESIEEEWYLNDDTHCSHKGYISIINRALERAKVEFPILKYSVHNIYHAGELSKMLGSEPVESCVIKEYEVKNSISTYSNRLTLPGNAGSMILKVNTDAPISKRLVLFGDSYFVGSLDYLSHLFSEVFYIRESYILTEVLECLEPDIVFTGCAERYLTNVPDGRGAPPFFSKFLNSGVDMTKLDSHSEEAFKKFFSPRKSRIYRTWFNAHKADI